MEGCGGDNIDYIACVHEAFGFEEAGDLVFFGDFLSDGIVGVIESDEFGQFYFFPIVKVKFSEVAHSEDAYFEHS